jgi:HD-like signal output (HDOD) protein
MVEPIGSPPGKRRIGELLVEGGYVTNDQIDEALVVQKRRHERIANILIDLGYLSESDFLEFLGTIPGSASIELSACEIEREILDLVPGHLARSLELVPIGKLGHSLTVAMVCPLDEAGREKLEEATDLKVRPVLCSRGAVYTALDRYYADETPAEAVSPAEGDANLSDLEDTLKLRRIAKLVEEIGGIPTLPTIIQEIADIVNDPDSSASDLADVISGDVGLSAKILKLSNSAAFGFSREISDIQHAIALLGFRQTQALAMSVPVFENLIKMAKFDFQSFWRHSLRCAKLSRLLSLALSRRGNESAFVAGLLHDIGQVVFAMSVRGKQEQADALHSAAHISPIAAEEKVLGITHAEIGYHLGEHWLLPPTLTAAIRYHHAPELQPQPQDISGVVFLANTFCDMKPAHFQQIEHFDEKTHAILGDLRISDATFRGALQSFAETEKAPDIELF